MAGFIPAIRVFLMMALKSWMRGSSPGHDGGEVSLCLPENR
jgi:hypothetical protein